MIKNKIISYLFYFSRFFTGNNRNDGHGSIFFSPGILMVLVCVLSLLPASGRTANPPAAVKGKMDLTQWNFSTQGNVRLKGEWEFYWHQLLTPDNFKKISTPTDTRFIQVPRFWNGMVVDGNPLTGQGYATLRLCVNISPGTKKLAIRLEDQATAYRLWINGQCMPGNGVVAKGPETSRPQYLLHLSSIHIPSNTIEIILQVSNYALNLGGPYRAILLGSEEKIQRYQNLLWAFDLIPLGMLLSIGLYHMAFFLLRKKERYLFYFGSTCLLLAIRIFFWGTRGKFITVMFPLFPWEIAHKCDLLTWYPVVPLLLMFFAELFPEERTVKALRFTQVTAVLAILTVIIFPARISNLTLVPYEIFAILNIAFVLHILIPAVMNKRKDALLFLSGVLIFFASAINEILNEKYIIHTGNLIHFGMVAMALVQAFALAKQFSNAFETNEILALKLNKKNKALSRSIQRLRYSYRALKDNIILKAALETQKQREEKVRLKVEKEALEKFRYQLNPHFLFNALASIRGAVSVDADVARDMVTRLSEYCRLTLDQGKKESVTIRESIEINKLYLEMEGLRLGDYLTVSISAPSDILNRKIPTNLLQPLVENAVKYGRLTSPDALSVRVIFKDGSKGRILLEVANTGAWMDPDSPDHPDTTGIGLENIQQQLSRLYPDDHCFSTREENGWVKVFIGMPTSMASVFQQRKEGV